MAFGRTQNPIDWMRFSLRYGVGGAEFLAEAFQHQLAQCCMLKKYAAAIGSSRPVCDVLLDDFDKGMTSNRLDEIFTEV